VRIVYHPLRHPK